MNKPTPPKEDVVKQRNKEREGGKYEPRKEQVEIYKEKIRKILDSVPKEKKSGE